MKPIVYLNKAIRANETYCKLVIKNPNEELKERLMNCTYLKWDSGWGNYVMRHTDHNIRMISDYLQDIAIINTRYLNRVAAKHKSARIDSLPTRNYKFTSEGSLTIHPVEVRGKPMGMISFKNNHALYKRLKSLAYIRYSTEYKRFLMPLNAKHLRMILNDLTPIFKIHLDTKVIIADISLLKSFWEQSYLEGSYISCPDAYLESMKLKNYSLNTMRTYHAFLLRYLNHFNTTLEIIDSYGEAEVNTYHRLMTQCGKFAYTSINQSLNAVKYYYREILNKPLATEKIESPKKSNPLPKVLSVDEISKALNQIPNIKHRSMVLLAYSSGIRIGELLDLKPADLDFERRMLHIRGAKGHKDRYTILSNAVVKMLKQYIAEYKPKEYLYEGQFGGKYSNSSIQKVWKRALKAARITGPYTFHSLRHSFATHLLENGTDLRYIQQLLGHASTRTTEIYTHISNKYISNVKSPGDAIGI